MNNNIYLLLMVAVFAIIFYLISLSICNEDEEPEESQNRDDFIEKVENFFK